MKLETVIQTVGTPAVGCSALLGVMVLVVVRSSVVTKAKMAVAIALMALLISCLPLYDRWLEAHGETTTREWLLQKLHQLYQSPTKPNGSQTGSAKSPAGLAKSPPDAAAPQSVQQPLHPSSPARILAEESPHSPTDAQPYAVGSQLVSDEAFQSGQLGNLAQCSWYARMTPNDQAHPTAARASMDGTKNI